MKIGTKSILFGAHQFLIHPITVLLAWRRLYKKWPDWAELITIFFHDIGYWGLPNMDGLEGRQHPWRGAIVAARIVCLIKYRAWVRPHEMTQPGVWGSITFYNTLLHSRDIARELHLPTSRLYAADKCAILFDPPWLYLPRVRFTGEVVEYKQRAIDEGHLPPGVTDRQWYDFYRNNVVNRPDIKALLKG